jgi:hypothetical protein
MRKLCFIFVFLFSVLFLYSAQQDRTYVAHYLQPFSGPQVYKDAGSGTLFYVESDGRHVAAISDKGQLLWIKDPFTDGRLSFYRTRTPQIVSIGPASDSALGKGEDGKFIAISFNSSQFGLLRIANGDFRFLGQD